ncbi:MAG TPA: metallophosphoesterase family protein, partial [Gemmatimonadaceae bacterium]|nr:metallophosphoesterase family protein [Gemmatimonadaceae bacterium]
NDGDREGLIAMAQRAMGAELFEGPHSMEIAGERILVVNDIGDVQARSLDSHSIVVHGCTHRQELKQRGDTLIVNPGEGCGWVYGTPGGAVIDLATRKVEFLSLTGPEWTN